MTIMKTGENVAMVSETVATDLSNKEGGALWGHVAGAETWYGVIGWLIVTLTVMGLIVSPMVYLAGKLIEIGDDG